MSWTSTSDLCYAVYGALLELKQFDEKTQFDVAGALRMQDLQYFNVAASTDINNASALKIAKVLDNILTASFAAIYKTGFTAAKAVSTLLPILENENKLVSDLSNTVDTIYSIA